MRIIPIKFNLLTWIIVLATVLPTLSAATEPASPQARRYRRPPVAGYYKGRITPHWLADNSGFWYMNRLAGDTREFILVRFENGQRGPAFDHARLARSLSQATGRDIQADKLPFNTIEFSPHRQTVRFTVDNTTWSCDLQTYRCKKSDTPLTPEPRTRDRFRRRFSGGFGLNRSPKSADGQWVALIKDHNVWVRPADSNDTQVVALSTDGSENNAYQLLTWAPKGHVLVAWRVEPGDNKVVYRIESSPPGGGRAILHTTPYALPGDKFPKYEVNLFDVDRHQQIKPKVDRFEHQWERPQLHWCQDQIHFSYMQVDRGHQRLRVIKINDRTGAVQNVVDERSKTFHDVCWHNLKDAGFPDRILWHKAVAKKYPYYDLSRVGIFGVSAGAQNSAAAVLFHPDFYKAAAAACGCHDNRMDKASWNEQWMGYPVGPQYSECSNIDNAGRLGGWLLLIVGEMDDNVPPENTMRFADALIKAGKDFDMLVVPGAHHGNGGPFGARKERDFFMRHLMGKRVPDRNAGEQ